MAEKITPRSENYSQWYVDIILNAKLADYSPVKGSMVIRPHGYALWEAIQRNLDDMFKATGHTNAYFPLLIPESFIKKEAEHVEGFSPELAVVTHAGGEELEEPLVIRPTSETIIWSMYKKWIQSYRDLPLLINQWANVLRWEKRTRLFLRTSEFLWQEGHTAHATEKEAREETLRMLNVYKEFAEKWMAIPVLTGVKSPSEKFAGAIDTYAIEAMMQDHKALQAGTSHFLGQNFAKAFDVTFQNDTGSLEYVWATSWGVSTRLVGALIMTHSDDKGLVVPPKLSPVEAVIIPIFRNKNKEEVVGYARKLYDRMKDEFRVKLDADDSNSPGWKFAEWEMLGCPVRIELGPRDMENGKAVLVRRDNGEKEIVDIEAVPARVGELLESIQTTLFQRALENRETHTYDVDSYDRFKAIFDGEGGFIRMPWCGDAECEAAIKEETKATIRLIPFEQPELKGAVCPRCGKPADKIAVYARSY
ncbi:proline--tRNA ligase [Sediminispirochaeta smaragdinae]|jgi:prolyl-tRNA synthetase|uniref:Proline--tRNA ligase n=1 Tax=Sediminispirochaeta smaragdinae (strain DSM 11293 / JCM 15392 / SEBR 4228) TaxID=573413 RepID=E1RAC6_SEDSS|nr:proline--tRNA ligase [Sediminispirochaeta smaragdinae]ADK79417.1 prolyl-tRNA synthetase [Sediminispirochaeta smaragdinae DSM 11293]